MTPIKKLLENGECEAQQEKTLRQQTVMFVLIGSDLYRQGYTRPLLRRISPDQADYVMCEIHEGYVELTQEQEQWLPRYYG